MSNNPHNAQQQMAAAKRRQLVAADYLRGATQVELAERYGVTQGTISKDLKKIREMWLQSALVDFNQMRAEQLAKIDALEAEYWKAWYDSQEEKTKMVAGQSATGGRITRIEKMQRNGDPRYLAGVQWCIQERIKLLGLYAPTKMQAEVSGRNGGPIQTESRGTYTHEVSDETIDGIFDILASIGAFGAPENGDQATATQVV